MMVGTTALILVLSVFNGFEGLVKSLYTSFYPDIKITPVAGKQLTLTKAQLDALRSTTGVKNFSLIAEEKALLQNGDYQSIIYLKGVDENYNKVTGVAAHLVKGEFNTGDAENPLLVLGAGIENAVSVQSDRNLAPLIVYLPRKSNVNVTDPLQSINADTVNTAGTFVIQQEFDNKYAITNLAFVKEMLEMSEDNYTAVEIGVDPAVNEEEVKKDIEKNLGKIYSVLTRYEQNRSLYAVMRAEKWVIYIILSIILVVAAFNMIGALTMLVLEKKADIGVLHSLGASTRLIRNIFLTEGLLLGVLGGGIGMLLAFGIAVVQIYFKIIPLQGGSFLIDYFPVTLSALDFILVGCTVILIAVIASYIPASKAARQQFVIREE